MSCSVEEICPHPRVCSERNDRMSAAVNMKPGSSILRFRTMHYDCTAASNGSDQTLYTTWQQGTFSRGHIRPHLYRHYANVPTCVCQTAQQKLFVANMSSFKCSVTDTFEQAFPEVNTSSTWRHLCSVLLRMLLQAVRRVNHASAAPPLQSMMLSRRAAACCHYAVPS